MFSPLNIRIGFFLAVRALKRASKWTTLLTITIMVLTFLNLVVVSGVLVGLITGSINAWHTEYTGDVIISALNDKPYIDNSQSIISYIKTMPDIASYSARYASGAVLEANYQTRKENEKRNTANVQVDGIDPVAENAVTGLADRIIEGSYLQEGDYDKILLGYFLLKKYVLIDSPGFAALDNVGVGSKIRVTMNGVTREVTVKGILKSKVDNVRRGAYMVDSELRGIIGRDDGNVAEISLKLRPGVDPVVVRNTLLASGLADIAKVQTFVDSQPQFLKDIVKTFNMLGNALSSIGLVVASITIFIVIFINAITRRKFIGILKGIGIDGAAIEISYIFQSIFYAVLGSAFGLAIVYGFLVPFFAAHPIDFPFSDGILVAPFPETMLRVALLVVSTLIAGYIPARMIVKRNTLDSILGRN